MENYSSVFFIGIQSGDEEAHKRLNKGIIKDTRAISIPEQYKRNKVKGYR
jgi:hypothetical protein